MFTKILPSVQEILYENCRFSTYNAKWTILFKNNVLFSLEILPNLEIMAFYTDSKAHEETLALTLVAKLKSDNVERGSDG